MKPRKAKYTGESVAIAKQLRSRTQSQKQAGPKEENSKPSDTNAVTSPGVPQDVIVTLSHFSWMGALFCRNLQEIRNDRIKI